MIAAIGSRLEQLIAVKKPYLKITYTIQQMAGDIDVASYLLSNYLNQQLGVRYNDFINRHRVSYFKEMVQEGALNSLTVSGIGTCCGFQNRNSLRSAFKRFTGVLPSEYIKGQTGQSIDPGKLL